VRGQVLPAPGRVRVAVPARHYPVIHAHAAPETLRQLVLRANETRPNLVSVHRPPRCCHLQAQLRGHGCRGMRLSLRTR